VAWTVNRWQARQVRILLVVNSSASSVTPRRREFARQAFSEVGTVTVVETQYRGHATAFGSQAVSDGFDCVVVLGGDGTLNEVATALAGSDCALVCLPGGSTNVFAQTIGLPNNCRAATQTMVDSLRAGSVRHIGLGEVNGRSFCFHVGAGWDAAVVARVERRAWLKRYAGHAVFVAAGLRTFFGGYDRSQPHFAVSFPGSANEAATEEAFFAVVLNSDPYTFVGRRPFTVSPATTLDRPFTVVTVHSMKVRAFVALMFDALGNRNGISASPHVSIWTDVTDVVLRRTTSMPYQVDGDYLGDTDTLQFRYRPESLRLVVPQ